MEDGPQLEVEQSQPQGRGRFAFGMALGTALGSLAVILILSILALVIYYDWRSRLDPYVGARSSKVTWVESTQPWVEMKDDKHGRVSGFSDGGWGSGDDTTSKFIGDFGLSKFTMQNGVPARIVIRIEVTSKTALSLKGAPWKPKAARRDKTPAEALFTMEGDDDSSFEFLQNRELTVDFRREGNALVAESIDASGYVTLPEGELDY